jgi:two-component system, OmpR family, response regulator
MGAFRVSTRHRTDWAVCGPAVAATPEGYTEMSLVEGRQPIYRSPPFGRSPDRRVAALRDDAPGRLGASYSRSDHGPESTPRLPLRVLCVDDNRDVADSEAMLLELYGCEVVVCYDGKSALAEALRFGPDVCLIDFNMPGMDGCTVARHLKAWRKCDPLYLIAVTACDSESAYRETAEAGFDMHLVKPLDWEELARALSDLEYSLGRVENFAQWAGRG